MPDFLELRTLYDDARFRHINRRDRALLRSRASSGRLWDPDGYNTRYQLRAWFDIWEAQLWEAYQAARVKTSVLLPQMARAQRRHQEWLRLTHNMPNADFQRGAAWFKAWNDYGKGLTAEGETKHG